MQRPSFHDLTPIQQSKFGNGVGPYWLPDSARQIITNTTCWFFKDASWRHHDFGYVVGGDRWDRARCDWKFLVAMARDAVTQKHDPEYRFRSMMLKLVTIPLALLLASLFFLAVRIGGQLGSFKYRDHYITLAQISKMYIIEPRQGPNT